MFQLNSPLRVIDRIVGQLMDGLKQMKLHRCVNIILVGDHGTDTVPETPGCQTSLKFSGCTELTCWQTLSVTAVFSGMEEAHCDRTEFLSNYLPNIDDIILVPGSLGRIRSRYPNNPKCEAET